MAELKEEELRELLPLFKLSIGDLTPESSTELEEYYLRFLKMGASEIASGDVSETVLASELGITAIVLCAKGMMEGMDIATNPTLNLIRNTLSIQTKGERYANGK